MHVEIVTSFEYLILVHQFMPSIVNSFECGYKCWVSDNSVAYVTAETSFEYPILVRGAFTKKKWEKLVFGPNQGGGV